MRLEFSLSENDYLTYNLYIISKNQKRKWLPKLLGFLSLLIIIYTIFNFQNINFPESIFPLLIFVFITFYVFFGKNRYLKKTLKSNIRKNYQKNIDRMILMDINEDFIIDKQGENETKTSVLELTEIISIPTLFLLKISENRAFIISKSQINIDEVECFLRELSNRLNVKYIEDLKFKQ